MPQKDANTRDSKEYLDKKRFINSLLTVYGRKTVLEVLQAPGVRAIKLHLAESNKSAPILRDIEALAAKQGAEIQFHDKHALSRISKNAKQDQGVALDIKPSGFSELDEHTFAKRELTGAETPIEFIALDRITNPQNLGMIIRSVCASGLKGLILPRRGCAKLDALVIKASAGTLFRAPIIRCETIGAALEQARIAGADIIGLDLKALSTLSELEVNSSTRVFVLGNESEGISKDTQALCTHSVKIPMNNQVESLNVAVTASLIAMRHQL